MTEATFALGRTYKDWRHGITLPLGLLTASNLSSKGHTQFTSNFTHNFVLSNKSKQIAKLTIQHKKNSKKLDSSDNDDNSAFDFHTENVCRISL